MSPEQLVVPDFNNYSFVPALSSACLINSGVEVRWEDGLQSRVPFIWLREYSPDSTTFHTVTREQILSLTEIPEDLRADKVSISEDGFLCVHWLPESLKNPQSFWRRGFTPAFYAGCASRFVLLE